MLEAAVHRVVLHLVGEVVGVGRDIDHGHDVDLLAQQALVAHRLEHQAADPPETVDPHSDCHRHSPVAVEHRSLSDRSFAAQETNRSMRLNHTHLAACSWARMTALMPERSSRIMRAP